MRSIESLIAFLDKRRDQLTGDQISQIMDRAQSFTETDKFHEGVIDMIFENAGLAEEFRREISETADTDMLLQIEFGSSQMGMN